MKHKIISWAEFELLTIKIIDKLKELEDEQHSRVDIFNRVFAVSNGGLCLGVLLAKYYGVYCEAIDPTKVFKYIYSDDYHRVLIVDDILDHGITMQKVLNRFYSNASVAVLHSKQRAVDDIKNQCKGVYSGEDVANDERIWYVYPWERLDL